MTMRILQSLTVLEAHVDARFTYSRVQRKCVFVVYAFQKTWRS